MQQDMKEQLLTKKPKELMFQLSIPAVIGMFVIGLYPLMDGIFAGNIIGQTAMTACGIAAPLTFFNSGVSTLLGMGSASILSRALGKGDRKTVDKIMGNLIFWVILFSGVILIGGIFLSPYFLSMVGATGEIKDLGIRYLRVIFLGSFFCEFHTIRKYGHAWRRAYEKSDDDNGAWSIAEYNFGSDLNDFDGRARNRRSGDCYNYGAIHSGGYYFLLLCEKK